MTAIWRLVRERVPGCGTPEIAEGTYAPAERDCEACGTPLPRGRRRQPLRLEWPEGEPRRLADVTWPAGVHSPVLRRELAEELGERCDGFEPGPVEGVPGVAELWLTQELAPREDSTIAVHSPPCPACGLTILMWGDDPMFHFLRRKEHGVATIEGVEWRAVGGGPRHPWREGAGLRFDEPRGFFRLPGEPKFVLCDDDARRALDGLTGVGFLRAG